MACVHRKRPLPR